jgi:hypothetical protein
MAQLTVAQFQSKLAAKAAELAKVNLPLKIAAQTVHAFRVDRIFHKGVDGASYNTTTPLYVSDNQLRRRGPHRGKTGKPIKTNYFKSYFDLKQNQGFDPNIVNLRLTNNLQSDFANVSLSPSNDSFPASATPIKIDASLWVERLDRPENVEKYIYLSKKYRNPFRFTKSERKLFQKVAQEELIKLLKA